MAVKNKDKNSTFSRLRYLDKQMANPNLSQKEIKILKMREQNLMDMLEDGQDTFSKGGKVMKKGEKMPLPKAKPRHANPKHPMNTERTGPLRKAAGGKLKMVEKGGKKVPFFAADGKGKMAMGGMMKKKGYAKGGAVKVGEKGTAKTLSQIAKQNGVTLKALLGANPSIKNANKIRLGQSIKLPTNMAGSKSSNPYAGIKRGQMADMDVKNKSEKRQRRATRSMQTQVKQGGSRTTPTPSRAAATKESKSGREAMLAKARKLRDSKKAASKLPKQDTNRIASTPASKLTETRMARLAKTNRANRRMGGGSMKKVQGYKSGGVVRGAGAATRGKGFNRAG